MPSLDPLAGDVRADVVVIGGGLTGILSAYLLAKAGRSVALLEAGQLGQGATVHTTAMLSYVIDTSLVDLVRMFGERHARQVWESGRDAIDLIERIIQDEGIACDFRRCDAYICAHAPGAWQTLADEHAAARRLGFETALERSRDIGVPHHGCLVVSRQAKFHPMKFLAALVVRAQQAGVRLFEHSAARDVMPEQGAWRVRTSAGAVRADHVIVATYDPFHKPSATRFKKGMYKSYVVEAQVPQGRLPDILAWDTANPYHYLRVDRGTDHDRIIVGGGDHRMDIPFSSRIAFRRLETYLDRMVGIVPYTITRHWTGPILESSDGLPLIGETSNHLYIGTAFSGNGMTYAAVAALMFRDFVTTGNSPWRTLYDPRRHLTLPRLVIKGRQYLGRLWSMLTG